MGIFGQNIEKMIDSNDTDGLLKLIEHKKPNIRLKAFLALAKNKNEEVLLKLRKLLSDPDPRVKTIATLKFGEFGDKSVFENFRSIILSGNQREKIEALRILSARGKTDEPQISNILFLALKDKRMLVMIEAIRTMGAIKDRHSVKHLVDILDSKNYNIRLIATRALGEIGGDLVVDPLISSLVDNNVEVRRAARDALKRIGTDKAVNALNDATLNLLVKRMTEGESVRRESVKSIGQMKLKEGAPLLKKACSDEYKNIRLEAVRSIGLIRDKSSVETVVKLLDDPYFDVRLEAVRTLEKIFHPLALKGIEKAMNDKNTNVREEAKRSYYSLKTRLENFKR
jgi:HEAT repeat protein